jgi:carbonic anhydrase
MNLLNSILTANRNFVHPGAFPPLPKNPKKQFAIFTCMDTRLVDFLEPAMGIKRGDAKVIKNAGNTLVDPLHGGVIRSLVAAIFMLGVEEIFVIGVTSRDKSGESSRPVSGGTRAFVPSY